VLFEAWHQFARGLADRIDETGVLDERGIGFDETVVAWCAVGVEQHVDHAQGVVDRVEHGAVALFAGAQLLLCLELAGGVDDHAAH